MWRRFIAIFRRNRLERELASEIDFHLEMLIQEKVRLGRSEKEALAEARREFGGIDQVKEASRDLRGLALIESFFSDCAYGLRAMRRNLPLRLPLPLLSPQELVRAPLFSQWRRLCCCGRCGFQARRDLWCCSLRIRVKVLRSLWPIACLKTGAKEPAALIR